MCGIFGIAVGPQHTWSAAQLRKGFATLARLSESRGREAAGFALRTQAGIVVHRTPVPATAMLKTREYRQLMDEAFAQWKQGTPLWLVGHSRLATNGLQSIPTNNQPVVRDGVVCLHNGIVVNDEALWKELAETPTSQLDTEVIAALFRRECLTADLSSPEDIVAALGRCFAKLDGAASISIFLDNAEFLALATNTGSLYTLHCPAGNMMVFASEKHILDRLSKRFRRWFDGELDIQHVCAGQCVVWTGAPLPLRAELGISTVADNYRRQSVPVVFRPLPVYDTFEVEQRARESLRRCSHCILPETFPFIEFDAEGVCNYCREYQPPSYPSASEIEADIAQRLARRGGARYDCLVAISGGRDSTYGLHYVVRELGLRALAFTYDWGLVTDLARRNSARVTGRLGVEHIIVSADIRKKRRNVRRNIEAWIRRPHLGMIPLFMAGDKQYFEYARRIEVQAGAAFTIFCGNRYEKTNFKTGFAGVREGQGRLYDMSPARKTRLGLFYLGQLLRNPLYLNRSLLDSARSFVVSYIMRHDFALLYNWVPWDEQEIMKTLRDEYDWEEAQDTDTTWRIGDGTAAFYNYIYYTVAGFTENDTFFSNLIRDGHISRQTALERAHNHNQPRWESLIEYARTIGFDFEDVVCAVQRMPKLYELNR